MSEAARTTLWRPLYLSLGLAVALMLVGAVYDWRGEATARASLPWAAGAGVLFFALTQGLGGAFVLFIIYEGVATCVALIIYTALVISGGMPGAGAVAVGIALSLVAAAIQASSLSVRVVVGSITMRCSTWCRSPAVIVLASGLGRSLREGIGAEWPALGTRADHRGRAGKTGRPVGAGCRWGRTSVAQEKPDTEGALQMTDENGKPGRMFTVSDCAVITGRRGPSIARRHWPILRPLVRDVRMPPC